MKPTTKHTLSHIVGMKWDKYILNSKKAKRNAFYVSCVKISKVSKYLYFFYSFSILSACLMLTLYAILFGRNIIIMDGKTWIELWGPILGEILSIFLIRRRNDWWIMWMRYWKVDMRIKTLTLKKWSLTTILSMYRMLFANIEEHRSLRWGRRMARGPKC